MTHEHARELAATAIDFALAPGEQAELDAHLAGCEACRRFADAARRDHAALVAMPLSAAPPRIHDALRRAEASRGDRFRPLAVLITAGLAGAIALSTLGGGGTPDPSVTPPIATTEASIALATTSPETATTVPSAEPPTAVPAQPSSLAWAVVPDQTAFHDPFGVMEAVAAGERLVAVGDGCSATLPDCHMAIWTSEDGASWERIPDDPMFAAGAYRAVRRGELTDVASSPTGYVAVGRSVEEDVRRGAAFWSPDGLTWTRSADDETLILGSMEAVAATPGGFVAVGNVRDGSDVRARAWTSPDGLAWVRAPDSGATFAVGGATGTFTDGRERGGMIDVAWTGTGLVAVGSACFTGDARCHGVAWGSDDGRDWTRLSDDIDGTPYAITVAGDALVVAGDDGAGHPASWMSADGRTWKRGAAIEGLDGNFDAIAAVPGGLVGIVISASRKPFVVTSTNGRRWEIAADPDVLGSGVINGLAWDAERGISIGVGWDGRTPAAAVWVGR